MTDQNVGFSNKVKLEVLRGGVVVKDTPEFKNLFTLAGLERLCTMTDANSGGATFEADRTQSLGLPMRMTRLAVGTSSAEPSINDTSLGNEIAVRRYAVSSPYSDNYDGLNPTQYYQQRIITWEFPQGAAAGNLSELGIKSDDSNTLYTRALIKDQSGNPTTITVLSDEVLRVTYTLRVYPYVSGPQPAVSLNGVNVTHRMQSMRAVGSSLSWLQRAYGIVDSAIPSQAAVSEDLQEGEPFSTNVNSAGNILANSVSGSFSVSSSFDLPQRELTITVQYPPGSANLTNGIRSFCYTGHAQPFIDNFDPPLMKTNLDRLTFTYKVSFNLNYTPPE